MIKPLFQNVIVAINGSGPSIQAAMYGILFAKQYRTRLKFVYVVDSATIRRLTLSNFFVADEAASYGKSLREDGQKYINYVMDLAKSKGVKSEGEVRDGSVWLEIINAADDMKADLIILGGGTERSDFSGAEKTHTVFSQTYKDIICHANCSVMVVNRQRVEQLFRLD